MLLDQPLQIMLWNAAMSIYMLTSKILALLIYWLAWSKLNKSTGKSIFSNMGQVGSSEKLGPLKY